MTHTFKLSKPLKTHDGEITELKLKEPKARLFFKYGDPFKLAPMKDRADLEFVFDKEAIMQFISEMTGIDDIVLGDLSTGDYYRLRQDAANFILGIVPDKDPSGQSVD